ncbi:zinc finger, C2H2 type, partial [Opisthorchis viverrini]
MASSELVRCKSSESPLTIFIGNNSANSQPSFNRLCPYCLTKSNHPRLGRGEAYVCGYKPYRCEICNYSTTTKGNLAIHQQSDKHLNNVQELEQTGVKPVTKTPTCSTHTHPAFSMLPSTHLQSNVQKASVDTISPCGSSDPCVPRRNGEPGKSSFIFPRESLTSETDEEDFAAFNNGYLHMTKLSVDCNSEDTLSTEKFVAKLTESSPYPFACQVCFAFTTDKLDVLLKHAERIRIPLNQNHMTPFITTHSGGFWLCRLCSYKSPLKANFQLHCKTEKHSQRLSLLLHVCEGGPANQLRVFGLNVSDHKGGTGTQSHLELIRLFENGQVQRQNNVHSTSNVQLLCLACDVSTTSVHKFRIHCQCSRHLRAVALFSWLVSTRSFLWNKLATWSLTYMDKLRESAAVEDSDHEIRPVSVSGKFSETIRKLSHMLTQVHVEYRCFSGCSNEAGQEYEDTLQFETMAKALSHWHSLEHQQRIMRQSTHWISTSECHSNVQACREGIEVIWVLDEFKGSVHQWTNLIAQMLDSVAMKQPQISSGNSQSTDESTCAVTMSNYFPPMNGMYSPEMAQLKDAEFTKIQ